MDQPTFADMEYRGNKRKTRRELFLERMDRLIPWQKLEERIRPGYPKPGKGRRPYPLAVMLGTRDSTSEMRTWGVRWNGRWRCVQ